MKKILLLLLVFCLAAVPAAFAQSEDAFLLENLDEELDKFDEAEASLIVQRLVQDDEADQAKSLEALKAENEQIAQMRQNAAAERDALQEAIESLKLSETNLVGESEDLQARSQRVAEENKRMADDLEDVTEGDDMVTADTEVRYQTTTSALEANESLISSNEQAISNNEATISGIQQQIEEFEEQIERLNDLIDQCDALTASNLTLIKLREEQN